MNIDIITFSLGREYYLSKCIESVKNSIDYHDEDIVTHHVIFQGYKPSQEFLNNRRHREVNFHFWKENVGIGEGLNRILSTTNGDLVIKFDEDAKFVTYDNIDKLVEIHQAYPDRVFSPFVIGLQNNLGGVPGYDHEIYYNKATDEYHMLRMVKHIGGIARCVPRNIYDRFTFTNDLDKSGATSGNEDGQFSAWCNAHNIKMMYMDTHIVVEHQEGTLCQKARYPEYFSKRR